MQKLNIWDRYKQITFMNHGEEPQPKLILVMKQGHCNLLTEFCFSHTFHSHNQIRISVLFQNRFLVAEMFTKQLTCFL